jgi:ABC-type lipoprotein release transport system permease subunit
MAMVFLAVILATAMQSLQKGVYKRMIENVVTYHTGYLQVADTSHWNEGSLDAAFYPDTLEDLTADLEVDWIHRIENGALVVNDSQTSVAIIIGTNPDDESRLTGLGDRIVEGSLLKEGRNGLIMARGLAERMELSVGDSVIMLSQGYRAQSAGGKFRLEGIASFGSPDLDGKLIYMTLKGAQDFYSMPGLVTKSTAVVGSNQYRQLSEDIQEKLSRQNSFLAVRTWEDLMPELVSAVELDSTGGKVMLAILYFIISFGIFGTVLMMLQERKREFGVLTAIGMRKEKLSSIVNLELVFMSLMGAVAGMIGAIPVILFLHHFPIQLSGNLKEAYENYGFEPVLQAGIFPEVFLSNMLVVLVIAMIISIYPRVVLKRMQTIENLRR